MKYCALIFCLFFLCGNLVGEETNYPTVVIKDKKIEVAKDKIYLGDIAFINGFDIERQEKLKVLYIVRAAMPGEKVTISKELIENKVKRIYQAAIIEGPDEIEVFTEKSDIAGQDVAKTAKDYLFDHMKWPKEDVEITVSKTREDLQLLQGKVLLKVKDNNINFKGNVIVPVEIYVNNQFYKIEPVKFFVKVNTECVVSETGIKKGDIPDLTTIIKTKKDITYLPEDVITDPLEIQNRIAKRAISPETVLLYSMFESRPLFKRGDTVYVIVKIKSLEVQSEGQAFSDGREGEKVKVKLINGNKIVEGIVNSDGKVIIEK